MRLSLVIPAYNEADRIGETLEHAAAYFTQQGYDWEIIVVDDGSDDGTAAVTRKALPSARVISYQPNRGKGHAVREGMTAATGDVRVFYDADASTPIEELEKVWPRLEAGADIVIGSRALPDSVIERPQPWYRRTMGRAFNLMVRALGLTPFRDTQCGFKVFTARACDVVFPRQTITHFSFDVELLDIAQKHGLRIDEVPVRWINCPHTTLNAAFDSLKMLRDMLRIRLNDLRGRYA